MGKVLVVDDDNDVCQLMLKLLKRASHHARCALNGPDALEMVRSETPDLILLDIMMPEMSGIEVLRRLRNDLRVSTPIIIFSALSDPAIRSEALAHGASDYWVKASMDLHDILTRLAQYLS